MTADEGGPASEARERARRARHEPRGSWGKGAGASVVCVLFLGLGFFGLHALMGARPEFIGRGLVFERQGLEQLAPTFVVRRTGDDTAVFARRHPDGSSVLFDMDAQSDARGLSTLESMRGAFEATYVLENPEAQPVFVLFRCPYPRSGGPRGERARWSGMKLTTETSGTRVDTSDAWLWSGELDAGASLALKLQYEIPRVVSIGYQVDPAVRETVRELDVAIEMDELPPMVVFASRDGERVATATANHWNRTNFLPGESFGARILEGQSLFAALRRLLEIGPLVALLFFAAAIPLAATRARLSTLHVFGVAAAYGLYFPLVLYLSVMLPFRWALAIAVLVPGLLLVNHARLLLGRRLGIPCAVIALLVYQLFPTLTAFAGWNRGLVLLCIGTVTLFVLAHLSNRSLRLQPAAALSACLMLPSPASVLGGGGGAHAHEPANEPAAVAREPLPLVSLGIVEYHMRLEPRFVEVEASVPVQVLRPGDGPVRLFSDALYLREALLPTFLRLAGTGPGLEVLVPGEGAGLVRLRYRVPVAVSGERLSASVPLARAPAGRVLFECDREGLEFQGASLWSSTTADGRTIHELGTSGGDRLEIASLATAERASPAAVEPAPELAAELASAEARSDLYGIGIVAARHLTVVGSDGAALHFAAYSLPPSSGDAFELVLPAGAGVLSATVDGLEVERPLVVDGALRIPLDVRPEGRGPHEVALRIDLGRLPLGFLGTLELELPRPAATTGEVSWAIALPTDFVTRVLTSGLDPVAGAGDVESFGEYGRALRTLEPVHLSKSLAPARRIACSLRYHQRIAGVTEPAERAAP
jgi:hypothetical protein